MKSLLKLFFATIICGVLAYASPIDQSGKTDGYGVDLKSQKSLVVGNNDFLIAITKDGELVKDAKVKIKFYMPEMPGMPYMEYEGKAALSGEAYKTMINFSMSGTWQYQLKFKTADGKVHKLRGSVNL